jgi:DNA polymerase-3 subunit epsilon
MSGGDLSALPVSQAEFCAIDFESAGVESGSTSVPIQIGFACMRGTEIRRDSFFRSYLSTSEPVVWTAQDVHDIRSEDLVDAPNLLDLFPTLNSAMTGRFAVAHSAGVERKFLGVFAMHEFGPWVDTLKVSRAFFPKLQEHSLGAMIRTLELEPELSELCPGLAWHDALYDAVASLMVLRKIIVGADLHDYPAEVLAKVKSSRYYQSRPPRPFKA